MSMDEIAHDLDVIAESGVSVEDWKASKDDGLVVEFENGVVLEGGRGGFIFNGEEFDADGLKDGLEETFRRYKEDLEEWLAAVDRDLAALAGDRPLCERRCEGGEVYCWPNPEGWGTENIRFPDGNGGKVFVYNAAMVSRHYPNPEPRGPHAYPVDFESWATGRGDDVETEWKKPELGDIIHHFDTFIIVIGEPEEGHVPVYDPTHGATKFCFDRPDQLVGAIKNPDTYFFGGNQ
jgi:hypothetical protein